MVRCQSVRMVMSWIGHWYGYVSECQDDHVLDRALVWLGVRVLGWSCLG